MPIKLIEKIVGLAAEPSRILVELINALAEGVNRCEPLFMRMTQLFSVSVVASEGQVVRIKGGLTVTLPRARIENQGRVIHVLVETNGTLVVTAFQSLVNGQRFFRTTGIGLRIFESNGLTGWFSNELGAGNAAPDTDSGGASVGLDAHYLLGQAHASLPNGSVGQDTTEIDFAYTPGGFATWALNTASVVFAKLQNLTGLSVLGRAGNTTGVMAAITATAARQALMSDAAGTALAWRTAQYTDLETTTGLAVLARTPNTTGTLAPLLVGPPSNQDGKAVIVNEAASTLEWGRPKILAHHNVSTLLGLTNDIDLIDSAPGVEWTLSGMAGSRLRLIGTINGFALNSEPFVTYSATAGLTNERVLTAGSNVVLDTSVAGLITINAPFSSAGRPGPPGNDGNDGNEGDPGPPGPPGAAGATGASGPMGPPGFDGQDGQDGAQGPPGANGATGATGASGTVGAVAVAVAVNLGATPIWSGSFDITGLVGLTLNQPVIVTTGVDTANPDESEEQIAASGIATSTTAFRVYWESINGPVYGTRTFYYIVQSTVGFLTVEDDNVAVTTGSSILNFADSLTVTNPGGGQADIAYTGTASEVQLTGITGGQGVVDISTLQCGGRFEISAPTGAWSVDGFTARDTGFWFWVTAGSTNFPGSFINEASGATTSIRNPGNLDYTCNRQMTGLCVYGGTRWFFVPGDGNGRLTAFTEYNTGSGTHTYNAATRYRIAELVGGGGAGGGTIGGTALQAAAGGGGQAGACIHTDGLVTGGSTAAYVVGAGGTGVSGANGNPGSDTTLAGATTAIGGDFGNVGTLASVPNVADGGGDSATGSQGAPGDAGWSFGVSTQPSLAGKGGDGPDGGGGFGATRITAGTNTGSAGRLPGAGGSGAVNSGTGGNQTGGAGRVGRIRIWEYS